MNLEHFFGSSLIVSALVALVHAVRLAAPVVSKALADRAAAKLADANLRGATEAARAAAEADTRARLAHCEESHAKRDAADAEREERYHRREIEQAREMGTLRGMLSALRDQFAALPVAAAKPAAEGHV